MSVLRTMPALLMCVALAGCFGDTLDAPATIAAPVASTKPVDLKGICPPLKVYTIGELAALAASVEQLDKDSPLVPAMSDYKRMRADARACIAATK